MPFKADRALALLDKAKRLKRLSHAYLIAGPKEAHREAFAARFMNLVAGEQRQDLEDWMQQGVPVICPESKSRRITIDSMRELSRIINLKAGPSGHKFAVIVDAERMNEQAQNAFLKTLEEPPPGTLLLLLTGKPQELLPTIRSRVIEMTLVPEAGARQYSEHEEKLLALLENHMKRPTASMASALALKAGFEEVLDELRSGIEEEAEEDFGKEKELYGKTTDGSWLKNREDQVKALIEASYLQQRDGLLELLLTWVGDIVRQKVGAQHLDLPEYACVTKALSERWDVPEASRRLRALRKLETHAHTNVNENLALEVCFIEAFG